MDDLSRFSIELPAQGCAALNPTTATANLANCSVATNAGYFQFSAKPTFCLGEIVIRGETVLWSGDGAPLVAMTSNSTLIGVLSQADIKARGVRYAVAGFGVVVLNGQPQPEGIARAAAAIRALRPRAEEIAPRTIIAIDSAGRLLLVAIDGVEALGLGITLDEAAAIFSGGATGFPFDIAHGAWRGEA